uniref:Uncharacterized protein n=1 Tax=Mimiviridae sp. ChoanoV1 TaxID=2596887 RepID=A0A5B8IEA9_9VIRU|nr:hypothetical protein 6_8 [Mimiviridae sp. ChoanoV1]
MLSRSINLVRFYSTPTFHSNFTYKNSKKNILKKSEISNESNLKRNIRYNSYKNMYNCLPIRANLKQ